MRKTPPRPVKPTHGLKTDLEKTGGNNQNKTVKVYTNLLEEWR